MKMNKKKIKKAILEMDSELIDEILADRCNKICAEDALSLKEAREEKMRKTMFSRKKMFLIAAAAALVIAAVLIPLGVMMSRKPEPVTPIVTDSGDSETEKQTTPTGVQPGTPSEANTPTDIQPGTPTIVDPTKPTDDPVTPSESDTPTDNPTPTIVPTATTHEPTPPTPVSPSVQPIAYRNVSALIAGVYGFDLDFYEEPEYSAYRRMVETLRSGDGILSVKTDDVVWPYEKASVWLQPYAALEDIGIIEWVTFKDRQYQVCIYNFDPDVDAEGMEDYLAARFKEAVNGSMDVNGKTVCLTTVGDTDETRKLCGSSVIDGTRYYTVRVQGTAEELAEFLGILTFEKTDARR